MVSREALLTFIATRSNDGRAISDKDLIHEFGLSAEAAGGRLLRLWQERLIATDTPRPARYGFRLLPGEHVSGLPFRVTARGQERLRWFEQTRQSDEELL